MTLVGKLQSSQCVTCRHKAVGVSSVWTKPEMCHKKCFAHLLLQKAVNAYKHTNVFPGGEVIYLLLTCSAQVSRPGELNSSSKGHGGPQTALGGGSTGTVRRSWQYHRLKWLWSSQHSPSERWGTILGQRSITGHKHRESMQRPCWIAWAGSERGTCSRVHGTATTINQ